MFELKKIYKKIIIYVISLIIVICLLFLLKNITLKNQISAKYILDGDMSYSMELKEGSIISDNLDKQDLFVSSTIDNIIANFNYKFVLNKNINYRYRYKIHSYVIAELDDSAIIDKEVFRKDNLLFDSGYKTGVASFDINERVSLNYDYYNDIASTYNYSVNIHVKSKLLVQLTIFILPENSEEKEYTYNMYIPLEKNTFSITTTNNQYEETILDDDNNYIKLFFDILIIVSVLVFISLIIMEVIEILKYKKNHYIEFKYRKIMSDYDNIIAPINAFPKDKDLIGITILYFKSMIDIQKELHLPILCYKNERFIVYLIINNKLAYMYFLNNNKEKI